MREADETARTQGYQRLLLSVNARNERALSFYTKLGYREIDRHSFEVSGRSCDNLILGLSLNQIAGR